MSQTGMSNVCFRGTHRGCPVKFGSGLRCECECHPTKKKKAEKVHLPKPPGA